MGKGYSRLVLFILFSRIVILSLLCSVHTVKNKIFLNLFSINVFYSQAVGETHFLETKVRFLQNRERKLGHSKWPACCGKDFFGSSLHVECFVCSVIYVAFCFESSTFDTFFILLPQLVAVEVGFRA